MPTTHARGAKKPTPERARGWGMPKRQRHAREDNGGQTTTLDPDLVSSLARCDSDIP
jgi:hypothetical protein